MGFLTNVFFLISTALLIPCMLALLWYLGRSLLLVGQTLREYWSRRRVCGELALFSAALEAEEGIIPELSAKGILATSLRRLRPVAANPILAERIRRETELTWKADLERLRSLARNGPAFGLMGTLIPLGPALVGLAAGDLQTLSNNLIIAFATTVVGLLVAILAGTLASIKKHWYEADAILLDFAAARLSQQRTEDRGQRTEDGRQRTEDNGQRTEDRGQRVGSLSSGLGPWSPGLVGDQQTEGR